MSKNLYNYRKIDPRKEEDIKKYLDIQYRLDNYLKKDIQPLTEEQIKWLRIRMGNVDLLPNNNNKGKSLYQQKLENLADEHCFVCELDKNVIGYIFVCTYHVVNGERQDDDVGIISEIYVKDNYRNGEIAYNLLQLACDTLLNAGKNIAMISVQEDNPNRFLHFAMADKLINKEKCKRKDGTITISYDLLLDIKNLKTTTIRQLAFKAIKIKKQILSGKQLPILTT